MTDEKDLRIITPMPRQLVDAIDDYRFSNRIPSRSEAIRKLVKQALDARDLIELAVKSAKQEVSDG